MVESNWLPAAAQSPSAAPLPVFTRMLRFYHRLRNLFRRDRFIAIGKVNIQAVNGGRVDVHPSAILNSERVGYHVAMPFETTLIADKPGACIRVEENARIHGAYIHAWKSIRIGRAVLIAAGTTIIDANGHSSDVRYSRFRRYLQDEPKEVVLGDFVWVGMNCIILKGVEIGECAIVAAGSVAHENVPSFSVVGGNPARILAQRDPAGALPETFPLAELAEQVGFVRAYRERKRT